MSVAIDLPALVDCPQVCLSEQCNSCVIYRRWCDGYETCCGGGYAEMQTECRGQCDQCLGMDGHRNTWNVCGKKGAVLRDQIVADLPLPNYTVPCFTDDDLPPYLPVFERLPRGPLRDLPQFDVAGICLQDVVSHRTRPESWMRYAKRPVVLVAEQDYLQHEHEGWFPTWVRRARKRGEIWATTGIEYSCYADDGNLSHFWSIQRTLRSMRKARAEFVVLQPRIRLTIDDVIVAWLEKVRNIFLPFPLATKYQLRRFRRWVDGAGGIKKFRVLLAHMPIDELGQIPQDIRQVSTWADQSAFATAIAGGRASQEGKPKTDVFLELVESRRKRAMSILRR